MPPKQTRQKRNDTVEEKSTKAKTRTKSKKVLEEFDVPTSDTDADIITNSTSDTTESSDLQVLKVPMSHPVGNAKSMGELSKVHDMTGLTTDDLKPVVDLFFESKKVLVRHLFDSYHQFLEHYIFNKLTSNRITFNESIVENIMHRYSFEISNIEYKPPTTEDDEIMTPMMARTLHRTYETKLICSVKQLHEEINITSGESTLTTVGEVENDFFLTSLPVMVNSKYCVTNLKKNIKDEECKFDLGGYFIIKGSEKIIIAQERMGDNIPFVFEKRDPTFDSGKTYIAQINSRENKINGNTQIISMRMKKDNSIYLYMSFFQETPLVVFLRAMGIVTDADIIKYITYDTTDRDMINILRNSFAYAKDENGFPITTQEQAIHYLTKKLKVNKKYSETDEVMREMQKMQHVRHILTHEILPHMDHDMTRKAYYLGYIVNLLLSTMLGRIAPSDRDSYNSKRVDTPGVLLAQLFEHYFNKMITGIGDFFKKKNNNHKTPINVISKMTPQAIQQGIQSAMMTGNWISNKGLRNKKGVSQVLQRFSFIQPVTLLRRFVTPSLDASNNKITTIRQVHMSQFGFCDAIETPEGAKIGLVKNLSMMASITLMKEDQIPIINKILYDDPDFFQLTDVSYQQLKALVKVFINGNWVGMTRDPVRTIEDLRRRRRIGQIHYSVSFTLKNKELKVLCDDGRLIRPLLRVENNQLVITQKDINDIDLTTQDPRKIHRWIDLLAKTPHAIEYVDVDEQENCLVAMYAQQITNENEKMAKYMPEEYPSGNTVNRWANIYCKYSHCEFHPSMMFGAASSGIPFGQHNYALRNILNYSQSKHGSGIYVSNHRLRMDISYLMYHTYRPIVITRGMKYVGTLDLPAGENPVVAIAFYTGYNQEDSAVMNQTAIERGRFRTSTVKKYEDSIQKNQTTTADDIFIKPDPNQTSNMKRGDYNKLNEKGFVPEETKIQYGDILIGKVSQAQVGANTTKMYRCSSLQYKDHVEGIVDRVHHGVTNADDYPFIEMRIRSPRVPRIGDKFACYTPDHEVLTSEGWISIKDVTTNHKVASLNNGVLTYVNPTEVQSYDYDGKMYSIENNLVSLMVTPNHRMYVGNREAKYTIETAEKIFGRRVYFRKNCDDYAPEDPLTDTFTIPAVEGLESDSDEDTTDTVTETPTDAIETPTEVVEPVKKGRKSKKTKPEPEPEPEPEMINNTTEGDQIPVNEQVSEPVKKGHKSKKTTPEPEMITNTTEGDQTPVDEQVSEPVKKGRKSKKTKPEPAQNQQETPKPAKKATKVKVPKLQRYPELKVPLEAWLWYFGIYMAEGAVHGKCGVYISANKERVRDKLTEIEEKLPFKYKPHQDKPTDALKYKWYTGCKQLHMLLRPLGKAITKSLPAWVWRLKPDMAKVLVEAMILGDGHYMANGTKRYDTSSKQLADDFMRLALHAGYSASCILKSSAGTDVVGTNGHVYHQNADAWRLTLIETQNFPIMNKHVKMVERRIPVKEARKMIARGEEVPVFNPDEINTVYDMDDVGKIANKKDNKDNPGARKSVDGDGNLVQNNEDKWVKYQGRVYCCSVPGQGVIYIRKNGTGVWCGNSRNGQKATIGITLHDYDMPFTEEGIHPDIIINPHAIPTRMTMAQLIETITSKYGALEGCYIDGTPFDNIDISKIQDLLEKSGYNRFGLERMYCGVTGRKIKSEIFIGPTFYMRLKHLVQDKQHSRGRGPYQMLTRQPPEGRARGGGLRFGEMERDGIIAHGAAQFLRERFMETSDKYAINICNKSGFFADAVPGREGVYVSKGYDNYTDISLVEMPYTFKLLIQELMAVGIAMRINVKKDEFNDDI
jgi:DNA-directed RNA polymerase II subunit RPB2